MIIARAPFRLPLGGGGTDLPVYYKQFGGRLITSSINKFMYVLINEAPIPDKIKLHYSQIEVVDNTNDIKHNIIRETLKMFEINRPIEITSMADFSAGTGMGSSSAFTVALIAGLAVLEKQKLGAKEIAELACGVEMKLVGSPIGKQDQYASAVGGINEMLIGMDGFVEISALLMTPYDIAELENRLMIFYTGAIRDANEILAEQGTKITEDASQMHKIKQIGIDIRKALLMGDIDRLGNLFHAHWETKRGISSKMSSKGMDYAYDVATRHGALGGKIMGAGGGGLMLLCHKEGYKRELYDVMIDFGYTNIPFRFDFEGVKTIVL